jgi:hypothetical protein
VYPAVSAAEQATTILSTVSIAIQGAGRACTTSCRKSFTKASICASAAIWAPGGPSSDGTSIFVGTGNTAGALNPRHRPLTAAP